MKPQLAAAAVKDGSVSQNTDVLCSNPAQDGFNNG